MFDWGPRTFLFSKPIRKFTLVHLPDGTLVQRSLKECERRLDSSTFFRASRGCIVNLSQVKQPRLSNDGNLIFLLKDGKEVVLSRRQTVLFRATQGLYSGLQAPQDIQEIRVWP